MTPTGVVHAARAALGRSRRGLLLLVAAVGIASLLLRMRGVLLGRSDELRRRGRAGGRAADRRGQHDGVVVAARRDRAGSRDSRPVALRPGDLARADEARIQVALLPLLRGEIVVTEVRLVSPVLFVVRGVDGGWNVGATPLRARRRAAASRAASGRRRR